MKRFLMLLLFSIPAVPQRFLPDDPLEREPAPRDASKAVRRKVSDYYDFFLQMFAKPGEQNSELTNPVRAQGANSLGEPMDSTWYQKRHYYRPMSIDGLVRGPGNSNAPSTAGPWTVVRAKSEGVTPGFEFVDSKRRRYVLKFDPLDSPEIATAPDVLVAKFFYAVGYNVPENYIVFFTRDQLVLGEDVELLDSRGRARKMTDRDVTELLLHVPKNDEGKYRGGASLYVEGRPLGPYKYYGTRRDDPNDIIPHEHRRELRGLSVFCAWLGHDDSRAINTLDSLVKQDSTSYIRHFLIDFGSTLGSASYGPNSPRSGFDYLFSWGPAIQQFVTLGVAVPNWARARYPPYRGVGRFEADKFDAANWVAEYPNPAFSNRLPDDAFWGAKQVMAFTDDQIRAVVKTGEYSDPRAERWIADCLIKRRDKIGRAFFSQVLPLDRFAVRDNSLVFDDLAVVHRIADARNYTISWSTFDNGSGSVTPIPGATGARVPVSDAEYLSASIHAGDPKLTVTVYLRKQSSTREVVGVDRAF
jgi:hypothetical protein